MLWVIFPIPDPVTSFKKIHVPIRLAHRHSFNEQINHSDGYNGVITGFKYDNLHPNGAAKPWLRAKKGRQNWWEFHFVLYLGPLRAQETLSNAEGEDLGRTSNSATTIISGGNHISQLPKSTHWYVQLWSGENFSYFFGQIALLLELYSQPSLLRKGRGRELPHESGFKRVFIKPDPYWSYWSYGSIEAWQGGGAWVAQ